MRSLPLLLLLALPASAVAEGPTEEGSPSEEPAAAPAGGPAAPDQAPAREETPGPPAAEAGPADPLAAALARVEAALEALREADEALPDSTDPEAREALHRARSELRGLLVELGALRGERALREWLAERLDEPPVARTVQEAEPEAAREGLPVEALAALREQVEAAPFKDDKLAVLREGLGDSVLTTEQVASLLELFPLPSHRVDALILLHPRLADPENFSGLLATLKFESDRQAVLSGLGIDG